MMTARKTTSGKERFLRFKRELGYVRIEDIEPNISNPREPQGRLDIQDLKDSIREVGVLVPLLVFRKKKGVDKFVLLEGERRWRACKELYGETKDTRFSRVPVNILEKPPDEFENLQTMFNVHAKRKSWSRAAEAEALGKLMEIGGKRTSNTAKLSDLTGLRQERVEEDRIYLDLPADLRKSAFNGELGHYNLILLGRSLKTLEGALPQIFSKYRRSEMSRTLIKKVRSRRIPRARDFIKLSTLASICISSKHDETFLEAFDKLMTDPDFGIVEMEAFVDRELGYKVDERFDSQCKAFVNSLSAHLEHREFRLQKSTREILLRVSQLIEKTKPI